MVVAMAMLESLALVFYIILIAVVYSTKYYYLTSYFIFPILIIQYVLIIWMIPLNLNWSENLYSHLLRKSIMLFFSTIMSYTFVFYFRGIIDIENLKVTYDMYDALYFSIINWATVSYSDFKPIYELRLVAGSEAVLGILSIPLIFAMIWKYCELLIREKSFTREEYYKKERIYKCDEERGIFQEVDEDGKVVEIKQRYILEPCMKCSNKDLKVEKYIYNLRFTPVFRYMVHCECGNNIHNKYLAMTAAKNWNKMNKTKKKKK
jgi:hypothetical protein